MNNMEIHFYYDSVPVNKYICHTYAETESFINKKEKEIHTTSIANLSFDLLDYDYKIFLHENGKVLEAKPGMSGTLKQIRKEHNILKLWIAGIFNNYFNR